MTTRELQEAVDRAENGVSVANYALILNGFIEKGIPVGDINPRENVFTYRVWQAKGRQVRRGEHGVRVQTIRVVDSKYDKSKKVSIPWTATVFHISQTDPK